MNFLSMRILLFLAAVVGAAGSGWYVRDLQAIADQQNQARATDIARILAGEVSAQTATAIANIKIENKTIHRELEREIVTKTVYHDCVLPDDGLRILNDARRDAAAHP